MVLIFAHIPFVVNRAFSATPAENATVSIDNASHNFIHWFDATNFCDRNKNQTM